MPRSASKEYKLLAQRSRTNLVPLVVNGVAQALYVEGYRRSDGAGPAGAWQWWQANGLDARQSAIHRAALSYGTAFATITPGIDDLGLAMPQVRGVSPRRCSPCPTMTLTTGRCGRCGSTRRRSALTSGGYCGCTTTPRRTS